MDEWNSYAKALSHFLRISHLCLSFLRKFKKTCTHQGFKHPEFWGLVQAVGMPLSLIHDGEAASDVKEQESKKVRAAILGNSLRTDCFTYISSSGIEFYTCSGYARITFSSQLYCTNSLCYDSTYFKRHMDLFCTRRHKQVPMIVC